MGTPIMGTHLGAWDDGVYTVLLHYVILRNT